MLLTRAPLYSGLLPFSFDLHVLSAPPALILSRDQTLIESLPPKVYFFRSSTPEYVLEPPQLLTQITVDEFSLSMPTQSFRPERTWHLVRLSKICAA